MQPQSPSKFKERANKIFENNLNEKTSEIFRKFDIKAFIDRITLHINQELSKGDTVKTHEDIKFLYHQVEQETKNKRKMLQMLQDQLIEDHTECIEENITTVTQQFEQNYSKTSNQFVQEEETKIYRQQQIHTISKEIVKIRGEIQKIKNQIKHQDRLIKDVEISNQIANKKKNQAQITVQKSHEFFLQDKLKGKEYIEHVEELKRNRKNLIYQEQQNIAKVEINIDKLRQEVKTQKIIIQNLDEDTVALKLYLQESSKIYEICLELNQLINILQLDDNPEELIRTADIWNHQHQNQIPLERQYIIQYISEFYDNYNLKETTEKIINKFEEMKQKQISAEILYAELIKQKEAYDEELDLQLITLKEYQSYAQGLDLDFPLTFEQQLNFNPNSCQQWQDLIEKIDKLIFLTFDWQKITISKFSHLLTQIKEMSKIQDSQLNELIDKFQNRDSDPLDLPVNYECKSPGSSPCLDSEKDTSSIERIKNVQISSFKNNKKKSQLNQIVSVDDFIRNNLTNYPDQQNILTQFIKNDIYYLYFGSLEEIQELIQSSLSPLAKDQLKNLLNGYINLRSLMVQKLSDSYIQNMELLKGFMLVLNQHSKSDNFINIQNKRYQNFSKKLVQRLEAQKEPKIRRVTKKASILLSPKLKNNDLKIGRLFTHQVTQLLLTMKKNKRSEQSEDKKLSKKQKPKMELDFIRQSYNNSPMLSQMEMQNQLFTESEVQKLQHPEKNLTISDIIRQQQMINKLKQSIDHKKSYFDKINPNSPLIKHGYVPKIIDPKRSSSEDFYIQLRSTNTPKKHHSTIPKLEKITKIKQSTLPAQQGFNTARLRTTSPYDSIAETKSQQSDIYVRKNFLSNRLSLNQDNLSHQSYFSKLQIVPVENPQQ